MWQTHMGGTVNPKKANKRVDQIKLVLEERSMDISPWGLVAATCLKLDCDVREVPLAIRLARRQSFGRHCGDRSSQSAAACALQLALQCAASDGGACDRYPAGQVAIRPRPSRWKAPRDVMPYEKSPNRHCIDIAPPYPTPAQPGPTPIPTYTSTTVR